MKKMNLILRNIIILIMFLSVGVFGAKFEINYGGMPEGDSGTREVYFRVGIYGPCQKDVTYYVDYTTRDESASAGSDYVSKTGTIEYKSTKNVRKDWRCSIIPLRITINGDKTYESDENFRVILSNARSSNPSYPASIYTGKGIGIGTIRNDDKESFSLRYKTNLKGNMKIIGNTVLARKDSNGTYLSGTDASNALDQLRYVDIDSDSSTFNSSLAVLEDSAILTPTAAKVKWAGLYWTGYLHTYEEGDIDGSDKVSVIANTKYKTLTNFTSIDNVIKNHTVKFKIGNTTHNIATHTVLGEIKNLESIGYTGYSYACFAEVTSLMTDSDPRGTYSVANIPSMEGATIRLNQFDVLGNSGAWTLVVIYENNSAGEKIRNATVFDGFIQITQYRKSATIDVAGFRTPKMGNVDSTLSVFVNGGDKYLGGDQFIFKSTDGDKAGQDANLSSSDGDNNYFNSSITGVDNRTPNIENNNGIDIHTEQVGTVGTSGYNIVSTNQTKAQITFKTDDEFYYPIMVGFATELYMPKLCYDYSALLNGELMQKDATDRTFIPHKNDGTLQSKIFIRSLEGDFPYLKSSIKSSWRDITTPPSSTPPIISFSDALVQNPDVYAYEEPEYIDQVAGEYYIGTDKSGSGGQKGVIEPYKSLYSISNFDANNLYGSILQLNVNVKASLALDENDTDSLTEYEFSTSDGTLEICPGTLTYNPKWYQFNIEKYNAGSGDYALSTQVTGTDYTLQAASYEKDVDGNYTVRTPYTGAIEVEIFEVPSFQSLGGYDEKKYNFDRICEDSSNRKNWGDESNNTKRFVHFNNSKTAPIPINAAHNRYAMRNAGIRMWVLVKDNNGTKEIVEHNGTDFKTVYRNNYAPENKCQTECTSGSDETCYQCLKTYYSQPICSRDNFSVRPYGVELTAKSKAAVIQKNDTLSSLIHNLISGLLDDYVVEMVAKSANGQVNPTGYYFRRISSDARDVTNNLFDTLKEFFGIKFDNTLVNNSGDITNCADSSHKRFDAGASGWKLENDNVGNYDIVLVDKNWTLVDQARYPYKASVSAGKDDCSVDSTVLSGGINGVGCDVQSFEVNSDAKFNKIPVKYVPAKIDIQSIAYGSYPAHGTKWAY
ncbi:MAG: hypothetical protein IE881_07690, partial [Epsilonproteobacteria bacterium]|nr:hypothetical protein [Campylobacterota bacterium]